MQSAGKKRANGEGRNDYAAHSDFCAIFLQHLDRLYLLALILMGNEASAEKCFLEALDFCVQESPVFKESAVAWSRRSVIKTAIRLMSPGPADSPGPGFPGNGSKLDPDPNGLLKHVRALAPFDRFVFVMSVLERYSERDCGLLLGCSFADILPARIRALRQISRAEKSYPEDSSEAQLYRNNARLA